MLNMSELNNFPPVFIFGCYRSGTSLLRLMLNAHPLLVFPEETHYIPFFGQRLIKYGDLRVVENIHGLVSDILKYLELKSHWNKIPSLDGVMAVLPDCPNYQDVIHAIAVVSGGKLNVKYWGDKTPLYVESALYLNDIFPDAYYINVIRDGRDVAASVCKEPCRGGRTVMQVAEEWCRRVNRGRDAEIVIGSEQILTVRYEDLVSNTEAELRNVCNFLDIDYSPEMLTFYQTKEACDLSRQSHHRNVTQPVTTKSVGRYKEILLPEEIVDFEKAAGSLLSSLGYMIHDPKNLIAHSAKERLHDFPSRFYFGICFHLRNAICMFLNKCRRI